MNRLKNYSLIIISLLATTAAAFGQQASGGKAPTVQVGKNVNDAAVIEILEKHIAAIGGRDAQKAIKTAETQSETEVLGTVNKAYSIRDLVTKRFYTLTERAPTERARRASTALESGANRLTSKAIYPKQTRRPNPLEAETQSFTNTGKAAKGFRACRMKPSKGKSIWS